MDQYHESTLKKVSSGTGGMRRKGRDKKKSHIGGVFTSTRVAAEERKETKRMRGGNARNRLKRAPFVNVIIEGKCKKAKITAVTESHNPHYARQNIITKGAILNTELGRVRVTNRVGQDGVVNGILVK